MESVHNSRSPRFTGETRKKNKFAFRENDRLQAGKAIRQRAAATSAHTQGKLHPTCMRCIRAPTKKTDPARVDAAVSAIGFGNRQSSPYDPR